MTVLLRLVRPRNTFEIDPRPHGNSRFLLVIAVPQLASLSCGWTFGMVSVLAFGEKLPGAFCGSLFGDVYVHFSGVGTRSRITGLGSPVRLT